MSSVFLTGEGLACLNICTQTSLSKGGFECMDVGPLRVFHERFPFKLYKTFRFEYTIEILSINVRPPFSFVLFRKFYTVVLYMCSKKNIKFLLLPRH